MSSRCKENATQVWYSPISFLFFIIHISYRRMKIDTNTYKKYYVNQKDCSPTPNDYHIIKKGMILERVIDDEMA